MRQQGVTLIQMLLAVGLLALLAQLGTSSYSKMSHDLQQQATAESLAQALRAARSEALLRNRVVRLQALQGDWSKGWQVLQEQGDTPLLREYSARGGVRVIGNQPVVRSVRFSGLGVPIREGGAFQAGTLLVCGAPGQERLYQVRLSPSGRVRLLLEQPEQPLCDRDIN
ncbi:GspH/FimT family protein [Pseudomonas sp. 148P]|uniref:Type II secretion system protein H n=1 Tax=Pseudomonas ulcerans TaxID=3115852 RepID=A0ABU7I1G5_9PSED|nr:MULTISPECIES: GspH/FimT family protein [unclassified Pseudomonas]MEE1926290.1 GspH/FimT family protein [Pseudomonas sp. 147P]MEE1937543.1 GspH/FimT family protein [Pseudomonas sp. 148P]